MASRGTMRHGTQLLGHNFVPAYQVWRFTPHRHKVLRLYKKAYRALSSYDTDNCGILPYTDQSSFCFERTILRARFDENKHVTSLARATELLKGKLMLELFLEHTFLKYFIELFFVLFLEHIYLKFFFELFLWTYFWNFFRTFSELFFKGGRQ